MQPKNAPLSPDEIKYIRDNLKRRGLRATARDLDRPRSQIKSFLEHDATGQPASFADGQLWPCLMIAAVALVSFALALSNGFIWDDPNNIVNDPTVGHLSQLPQSVMKPLGFYGGVTAGNSLWRPLVTACFSFESWLFGKTPLAFHLTSLLIHAAVSVLFYFFLRQFLNAALPCFAGALLYAAHPVQSEAVVYIACRGDLLMAFFVMIAFLAYRRRPVLSVLSAFAAVLCKETAVVFVLVLLAYEWLILKERRIKAYFSLVPYGVAAGIYLALRFFVLGGLGSASFSGSGGSTSLFTWQNRLWMQPVYLAEYLKMILWPVHLHIWRQVYFPKHFLEIAYFIPLFISLSSGVFIFKSRRRSPEAFFGFLWFFIFLLPVANLLTVVNSPVAERWLYLPFMGMILCVLSVIKAYLPAENFQRFPSKVFAVPLLVLMAFMSNSHARTYRDDLAFFEYTTNYVSDPDLYFSLGSAYQKRGMSAEADQAYRQALELEPRYEKLRPYWDETMTKGA